MSLEDAAEVPTDRRRPYCLLAVGTLGGHSFLIGGDLF
jgi:hypothetical protein